MSDAPKLTIEDFPGIFESLYGYAPFRWQTRLVEQVSENAWPRFIKLPTSSGKTSCLDIAVFALAYQACRRHFSGVPINAPRRILFVVDRRIIVNEAYRRATGLKSRLLQALDQPNTPEYAMAWWLRNFAGNNQAPPLDCFELRGGIYRDDAWVRSLLQPTVITSTVDQVGSRLLFRGYGVSDRNLSIHAALTANDALILLDEAHCSNPFSQTMSAIARYRDAGLPEGMEARWSEQPLRTPFQFVEMTATPPSHLSGPEVFRIETADYDVDASLKLRHGCAKPVRLVESSAKGGKQNQMLAKHLAEQAKELAKGSGEQTGCLRVAIVVNRVACARETFRLLREEFPGHVDLMIGRMRPIDRERLTTKLQARFKSGSEEQLAKPCFVVATQCLEVGADFDFDGLVTQCANLDALRQRFGRLNRLGLTSHSRGVIIMAEGDKAPRKPDPIYSTALPATWDWLVQQAVSDTIDFGVQAMDELLARSFRDDSEASKRLHIEPINAPVLMPAHLDLLCQTGPRPALEPDITSFLHGPNRGVPEVRVCWRADLPIRPRQLDAEALSEWMDACRQTLAICPPSSSECLNVPLTQFKAWLRGADELSDESGDVLSEQDVEDVLDERTLIPPNRYGVLWNGTTCQIASGHKNEIKAVYPNSLVVLPATAGGWTTLGHVPDAPAEPTDLENGKSRELANEVLTNLASIDVATEGFRQSRGRDILRVHPRLMTSRADTDALRDLWQYIDENESWTHSALALRETNKTVAPSTEPPHADRSVSILATRARLAAQPAKQCRLVRYPQGYVVIGPRTAVHQELPRASFDDEFEEQNRDADSRISLADHLADVAMETERLTVGLDLSENLRQALVAAAERHDLGKADLRFQAMLLGSTLELAAMQPRLWAKSATGAASSSSRTYPDQSRGHLPLGFRHEMLSLDLAMRIDDPLDEKSRDVMLHVIAAHHGHARPLAPVVVDNSPPDVHLRLSFPPGSERLEITLSQEDRLASTPHRLDSGIAERFWRLNDRFGWWGLAWLETTLRLADWVASTQPVVRVKSRVLKPNQQPVISPCLSASRICCIGMSGANPLGFLSALGLLRTASLAFPDSLVQMHWSAGENWHPVISLAREISEQDFVAAISETLKDRQNDDHFVRLGKNINVSRSVFRDALVHANQTANRKCRTTADFLASFGSDALVSLNDGETIQDSAIRTMAGAGHQHFLETMRNLIETCRPEHIEKTLFSRWRYDDPTQSLSLRFDPSDDNRYALRWRDPSGDPARKSSGSMIGANRLAIEAIPLLFTAPGSRHLLTTGFTGSRSNDTFFHWPIWDQPIPLCVAQTALWSNDLISKPVNAVNIRQRGIVSAFCSQRITVGKVRNFSSGRAEFA
jgi:CRISPR-associated endonuclease/helicase Cas3